jgi:Fic family protein
LCIFEPIRQNNRLMQYNWQQSDWRKFQYDENFFTQIGLTLMEMAGQSQGYLKGLNTAFQEASIVDILVKEAIKTSAIEGELISRVDVISSIRKNLGYTSPSLVIKDKRSEGIAMLLVKTREEFDKDITEDMLFDWHRLLMRGNHSIEVGKWRSHSEPMQVISGAIGKEKIHFEAPPSVLVPQEMALFVEWFNATKPEGTRPIHNTLIRSAIAHLYFETIHPFEDGNGRIGRIISEKALAQGLKRPILMSLSTAIEADKKAYYEALQKAQNSNSIQDWIDYFGKTILKAQYDFIESIDFILKKTAFFDTRKYMLNVEQEKALSKMLEESETGFIGGMNARKYQSINRVSKSTATRHLQDLVEKGILIAKNSGRSTSYDVNI